MIDEFVKIWDENKDVLREQFSQNHPPNYCALVKSVITMLSNSMNAYDKPDPERITMINDGQYHGTLIFVIGASNYEPSRYWAVKINYGSCSGCDTLESIRHYGSNPPSGQQVDDYMTLALHVIQRLKEI